MLAKQFKEKLGRDWTLPITETLIVTAAELQEHQLAVDLIRQAETKSARLLRPETLITALSHFLNAKDVRRLRCLIMTHAGSWRELRMVSTESATQFAARRSSTRHALVLRS